MLRRLRDCLGGLSRTDRLGLDVLPLPVVLLSLERPVLNPKGDRSEHLAGHVSGYTVADLGASFVAHC